MALIPFPLRMFAVDNGIAYVTQIGLFSGVSGNEFAPMNYMTRGTLVSVLYHLQGTNYNGVTPFKDVATGA